MNGAIRATNVIINDMELAVYIKYLISGESE